jgi:5'-methylthioadenosine phosphorylase
MKNRANIAIIGGTGIYDPELFTTKQEIKVHTPYGEVSDLVTIGEYSGIKVVFLPRHGRGHRIPPHMINNRANIWALQQLGVKRIIAPSAVGSLKESFKPGDISVPDQFIDFTKNRRHYTFYDGGQVCHISLADPFCPELRDISIQKVKQLKYSLHSNGTYICVEGPRFSTRAESRFFRDVIGADIIGMTLVPEVNLAREAEICYLSIATITDYDVWSRLPVTSAEIIETLAKNVEKTKKLITELMTAIPTARNKCTCSRTLKNALV